MAIGFAVASLVVAVAGAAYGMYMMNQMKGVAPSMTNMQPNPVDAFQVSKVTEGVVVPVVFGTIKLSGNILWYGNLLTIPEYKTQTSQVQDGKSTKTVSQEYIAKYSYYLGMWQLLCEGPATVLDTWVNEKLLPLPAEEYYYAVGDGTNAAVVSGIDNPEIKALEGLAWMYMPEQFLGADTTAVQTLHFLVESNLSLVTFLPGGRAYPTTTHGVNPAAIVHTLLNRAGAHDSSLNMETFEAAADYWAEKDYGINMAFTAQTPVREQIRQVLSFVGGFFGTDSLGKFRLKAFDPDEDEVDTLAKEDFIDFQFTRKSWSDTNNVFTGNYIDKDLDYTKRTVSAMNSANIELLGYKKPMSIDLSAFIDRETASKRIWEIMKENSYPSATIAFSTFLHKAGLEVGDVIIVNHSDYGIDGAYYRIIKKSNALIDENKLSFTATQVVERIFDSNYVNTSGSGWVEPSNEPEHPAYQRVFELPYNSITGADPAYLLLSTKGSSVEIGFVVLISTESAGDYNNHGTYSDNALHGSLLELYPADTWVIDDDTGVLFTPHGNYPSFGELSRTQLFSNSRYALIDNEIIGFQDMVPENVSDYRLTGVIRGLFNTEIVSHNIASEIWLFSITNNVLTNIISQEFYIKMCPVAGNIVYEPALLSPTLVEGTSKAKTPGIIPSLVGIRTGASVKLEWWPITRLKDGAGTFDPGSTVDTAWSLSDNYPLLFDGSFEYSFNGSDWTSLSTTDITVDNAASFTFYLKELVDGVTGQTKTLTIGTADGAYKS